MEWTAKFITPAIEDAPGVQAFRTQLELNRSPEEVVSATLRYSAKGIIDVQINGRPVSDEVLAPGWSSYEWRLRYSEVDVTSLITGHDVELIARVADGWYHGRLAWAGGRAVYGDRREAIVQLTVDYRDGSQQVLGTDSTWRCSPTDVLHADLYRLAGKPHEVAALGLRERRNDGAMLLVEWGNEHGQWLGPAALEVDLRREPVRAAQVRGPKATRLSP